MTTRVQIESVSRAASSWYPAGKNRLVARMLGGIKIVVDPRDFSLTPHLVMDGFWESWITVWAMGQVTNTDRVLNIGANCGYYTLLFANAGARVVAVEPQGALAANIKLSALLNGWGNRIRVEQCVAGADDREVPFQLYPDFHGSPHVHLNTEEHPDLAGDLTTVRERPAHELMHDASCVFIDAEGYEPLIWKGLAPLLERRQLRWVALEWAPSRYEDPEGFLAALKAYGSVAVVTDRSVESVVSDQALLRGTDWDTLVVRRS